jgi:predicted RNA binding protein YcfA (HicA-like mRNA interferase family)
VNAREVVKRIRKVARVQRLDVEERLSKGSHRRYIVDGHCSTTVSWHPGDIPDGTLNKTEEQLRHCLGSDWLRR